MASLNTVMIIGNLGKDPEIRTFSNGNKVCNLSVATSESWRDKQSGEQPLRAHQTGAAPSSGASRSAGILVSVSQSVSLSGLATSAAGSCAALAGCDV